MDLNNYVIPGTKKDHLTSGSMKFREIIEDRIRYPYGKHEWLMVSQADKFKEWGVSMDDIKSFTTPTKDVEFINPLGFHGGTGSTTAHNQILRLINEATSYEEFVYMLNEWAVDRLPNGVIDLPEGLRR